MSKWSKSKGFTLIELMIVVAIIAILAAIAIPNYLRYAMKSKTAEATTNLGAIRTGETAYYAENDAYKICDATPTGGGLTVTPVIWAGSGVVQFADIGFEPDGWVRYLYQTTAPVVIPATFTATATGNLDEELPLAVYTIDSADPSYPKAVLSPPGAY